MTICYRPGRYTILGFDSPLVCHILSTKTWQGEKTVKYDSALQMFVENAHDLDERTLEFWRWLAQSGKLSDDMQEGE